MAESETKTFGLNLDASNFIKEAGHAKESILALGEAKNLEGLVSLLSQTTLVFGVIGAAAFGLKEAFDLVFDAEQIRQVNDQFDHLATASGVYADKLREELKVASDGRIAEIDLLKAANKAMIEYSGTAEHLGEIMQVARTQTSIMGGDLLSNFELIDHAIASGNQRALKQVGLIIDVKKAYREYGDEIGVLSTELTKSEQKQALMNAVLEKGQENAEKSGGSTKEATNNWNRFKVAIQDLGEAMTLFLGSKLTPFVTTITEKLSGFASGFKDQIKTIFGTGIEQTQSAINVIKKEISSYNESLAATQKAYDILKVSDPYAAAAKKGSIEEQTKKLEQLNSLLDRLENRKTKLEGAEPEPEKKEMSEEELKELNKRKANASKFEQELDALRLKRVDSDIAAATTIEQLEFAAGEKRALIRKQFDDQIKTITYEGAADGVVASQRAALQVAEIEEEKKNKLIAMEQELRDVRMKNLDQYVNKSQSTGQGLGRAFEAGSKKAQLEQTNFGKRGKEVFDSFDKNASSSLAAWGAGTKTASEAAKGFIFGMLGDRAEAEGKLLLLSSIWPPNPLGLAAGAGLIALGGFLHSQGSGGSSGAASAGSDASGGGTGGAGFGSSPTGSPTVADTAQQKKVVSVTVMGSYFETEQTKTRLVEMIRESSDATDFTVKSIGQ